MHYLILQVKIQMDKIENRVKTAQTNKYKRVPHAYGPQDVASCKAAVEDMANLSTSVDSLVKRVYGRLENVATNTKSWQAYELQYLQMTSTTIQNEKIKLQSVIDDTNHVYSMIRTRFTEMDVRIAENKRQQIRKKEYAKQKARRQKKAAQRKQKKMEVDES